MPYNTVNANDQVVNIAQIVQRAPTITLTRAFVRAYRDFCGQTRWLKVPIQGTTAEGTRQYDLGSDPYVDIIGVRGVQGQQTTSGRVQYWGLTPSDSSKWDPNMNPGAPMRFTYVSEAQIAVDPLPDKAYEITVSAIIQPKEAAIVIPEAPLLQYSNEIEAGALAYLLNIPGQKWSNPLLAAQYMKEFRSGVANAKANVQRSFNEGSMRVRPRGFVR